MPLILAQVNLIETIMRILRFSLTFLAECMEGDNRVHHVDQNK